MLGESSKKTARASARRGKPRQKKIQLQKRILEKSWQCNDTETVKGISTEEIMENWCRFNTTKEGDERGKGKKGEERKADRKKNNLEIFSDTRGLGVLRRRSLRALRGKKEVRGGRGKKKIDELDSNNKS